MEPTAGIIEALELLESKEQVSQENFCAEYKKSVDDLNIQINIDGYGLLNLPLAAQEIEKLCQISHPASFGWRDQTLLDKNIRNTAEIPASMINVKIGDDGKAFAKVLDIIRDALGLSASCTLTAHLHNLLIYSDGQFFAPHQDSEKLDKMVASLVVILPSAHLGGELVIDHHGNKKIFAYENISSKQVNFVAFYADCYHEVKPVKEGYRVALTFNLVLNQLDAGAEKTENNQALKEALSKYFNSQAKSDHNSPPKLAYLLDHSYTQHGLNWNLLKGSDRVKAYALKSVAKELGYEVHLTLANIRESWYAPDDYHSYRSRRYEPSEPEPIELIESEVEYSHWIDSDNNPVEYNDIHIMDNELCWTKANDELEPFESEYEGYMGNYGNTLDYWYHRAAIIIWRSADQLAIRFSMKPDVVFNELHEITKSPGLESDIKEKLKVIAPHWTRCLITRSRNTIFVENIIEIACYIQDKQLATNLLRHFEMLTINIDVIPSILKLQNTYGKEWVFNILKIWETNTENRKLYQDFDKLISQFLKDGLDQETAYILLKYQFNQIITTDKLDAKSTEGFFKKTNVDERILLVSACLQASYLLGDLNLCNSIIKHCISLPTLYPELELLQLLQLTIKFPLPDNAALKSYISTALHKELALGQRNENDWSLALKSKCKCNECNIFNEFLAASNEQKKIWPIIQERRDHIASIARSIEAPLQIDTEKRGSPHKIILTKKQSIHEQAKIRFDKIVEGCKVVDSIVLEQELLSLSS